MVTRGDTTVSRSVEWSFECSETTRDGRTAGNGNASEDVTRFVSDGGFDSESEQVAPDGGVDDRESALDAGATPTTPEIGRTPLDGT